MEVWRSRFSGCEAKKHGNYIDSACTKEKEKKGVVEPGKGKFEKFGPKFTGEGGKGVLTATMYECDIGAGEGERVRRPRADCEYGNDPAENGKYVLDIVSLEVECTSEHATGEAVGSHEVANVSVRFNGCNIFGTDQCKSHGASAEEVRTEALKGHLGYIEKAGAKVGVQLEPAVAKGTFTTLECENIEADVTVGVGNATEGAWYTPEATGGNDGIISPITPVNTMTPKFTQQYANANHENIPSHFEEDPTSCLKRIWYRQKNPLRQRWSPAGQTITNVNTVEGEEEIKA